MQKVDVTSPIFWIEGLLNPQRAGVAATSEHAATEALFGAKIKAIPSTGLFSAPDWFAAAIQ
jgi:hypothetical protein